jgi:hypothetical protein
MIGTQMGTHNISGKDRGAWDALYDTTAYPKPVGLIYDFRTKCTEVIVALKLVFIMCHMLPLRTLCINLLNRV